MEAPYLTLKLVLYIIPGMQQEAVFDCPVKTSFLVLLGVTDDFGVPLNDLCFANTISFINNLSIKKTLKF